MTDSYESKFDGEWLCGLTACGQIVKKWKKWYCKKNSPPTIIKIKCNHSAPFQQCWKYFIYYSRNGKIIEQQRIAPEAYETYALDKSLKKETVIGVEFITLYEHHGKENQQTKAS